MRSPRVAPATKSSSNEGEGDAGSRRRSTDQAGDAGTGLTLEEAINEAVRSCAGGGPPMEAHFPTYDMGEPCDQRHQGPALGRGARRLGTRTWTLARV
jgi:hypothetical protein